MVISQERKVAEAGDIICALGERVEIKEIISQEWYPPIGDEAEYWNIEFYDCRGRYRHYKNCFDGGHIIAK
ncbi:MAG: hypothetical protein IKH06_06025 [Clostridiales bacterium]|nr:hypothetical protein [Clostridiales bacterium]